jgi:hypothetical protein
MPKRIKQKRRPSNVNQWAHVLVTESAQTEEDAPTAPFPTKEQISILMATLGRKGGKIGGKRRMATMTAAARSKIARKASQARWARKDRAS